MLHSYSLEFMIKSVRLMSFGALLAAVPLCLSASTTTVDFGITLGGQNGSGSFTYSSTPATSDTFGGYVDAAAGNLQSFDLTYNSVTYTMADALDAPLLPVVTLPGNTKNGGSDYGFLALWVVSGDCSGPAGNYSCTGSGGGATILELGKTFPVFEVNGVTSITISGTGSQVLYNIGPPNLTPTFGTINFETVVPEPVLLPITAFGLAALAFVRRRRSTI